MKVRIIGAGLSGLMTAHFLAKRNVEVEIFESAASAGGLIQTDQLEWGMVERSATTLKCSSLVKEVLSELKIDCAERLPNATKRFLLKDGQPSRWPLGPVDSLKVFARLPQLLVGSKTIRPVEFETLLQWSHRCFGTQVSRQLILPAFQGVYGDHTEDLSASLVIGKFFRKAKSSGLAVAPMKGMSQLCDALVRNLALRGQRIHFKTQMEYQVLDHPQVFAGSLRNLQDWLPVKNFPLANLTMKPVTSISCFFEKDTQDLQGFGMLYPPSNDYKAMGSVFNSALFAERSKHRSETWYYPGKANIENLIHDRARIFGRNGKLLGSQVSHHPNAFPSYTVDLERALKNVTALPQQLYLMGNYLGEIGISGIIDAANDLAEKIARQVPAQNPVIAGQNPHRQMKGK